MLWNLVIKLPKAVRLVCSYEHLVFASCCTQQHVLTSASPALILWSIGHMYQSHWLSERSAESLTTFSDLTIVMPVFNDGISFQDRWLTKCLCLFKEISRQQLKRKSPVHAMSCSLRVTRCFNPRTLQSLPLRILDWTIYFSLHWKPSQKTMADGFVAFSLQTVTPPCSCQRLRVLFDPLEAAGR